jgi:hypothetical protein
VVQPDDWNGQRFVAPASEKVRPRGLLPAQGAVTVARPTLVITTRCRMSKTLMTF